MTWTEDTARAHLEALRWPDGVICPFCEFDGKVKALGGKSMGPGWYHCDYCRVQFTVRSGTPMQRSHLPLAKWMTAADLIVAGERRVWSLAARLGCHYRSADRVFRILMQAAGEQVPWNTGRTRARSKPQPLMKFRRRRPIRRHLFDGDLPDFGTRARR